MGRRILQKGQDFSNLFLSLPTPSAQDEDERAECPGSSPAGFYVSCYLRLRQTRNSDIWWVSRVMV